MRLRGARKPPSKLTNWTSTETKFSKPVSPRNIRLPPPHILICMDKAQALAKARRFAETAYSAELDKLSRQFQDKLKASRAQMAANGNLLSGGMIKETARINAERISALL